MTKLLYLDDNNLFESSAKIININEVEGRVDMILDQTIFYPQGGGQPCDKGQIICGDGVFEVEDTRLDPEGIVHHYGILTGNIKIGDEVKLKIDESRRVLNSRLHSAGHLIDCGVKALGWSIKPLKGYHFPNGPYVEYIGELDDLENNALKLQSVLDEMISKDLKVEAKELSYEEAQKQGIYAPEGKNARIVSFEGCEYHGCGGIHVNSSKEIGKIIIKKIKSKKGNLQISYEIE